MGLLTNELDQNKSDLEKIHIAVSSCFIWLPSVTFLWLVWHPPSYLQSTHRHTHTHTHITTTTIIELEWYMLAVIRPFCTTMHRNSKKIEPMPFSSKNVNNVFYKRYILLKLRCFKILRYTIIL